MSVSKKNPLRPLLNIREIREEQASREFLKRKRAVAEAKEKLELRVQEANAFAQALLDKEDGFTEALIRNSHLIGNVNALRRELESWRHRMVELNEAVEQEKILVASAEDICAKARAGYQAKTKEKMKTETFADLWQAEATKEQEFREEVELEDRLPKKPAVEEELEA